MPKKKNLRFFISYSHKDMKYKTSLLNHLKSLEYTHNISIWHDGKIDAGNNINKEVLKALSVSDVILLLVSPNFLASMYCMEVELQKAIEKHNNGKCLVIPVMLSECLLDESLPFYSLKRVPEDGKPIQKFNPQTNGYTEALAIIKQSINNRFSGTRKSAGKEPISPISINLYQNGTVSPYIIDNSTWSIIQTMNDRIIDFEKIMTEKLVDFILKYKQDFPKAKKSVNLSRFRQEKFKTFLLDISLMTREWLFKDVGVRVHFRVLNKSKDQYVGFVVVDGKAKKDISCNWAKKITPISTTTGMIYHSGEVESALIKSKNEQWHNKGKNDSIYVDYITSALKFKEMYKRATPLMSMGISIEKEFNKQYAPYLIALTFFKFDVTIENLITVLCTEIKNIDKEFDLASIV